MRRLETMTDGQTSGAVVGEMTSTMWGRGFREEALLIDVKY